MRRGARPPSERKDTLPLNVGLCQAQTLPCAIGQSIGATLFQPATMVSGPDANEATVLHAVRVKLETLSLAWRAGAVMQRPTTAAEARHVGEWLAAASAPSWGKRGRTD